MRATARQIRAIQSARRTAGLAEDSIYRDALRGFGVVSSKELTIDQAAAFLDRLNRGSTGSERPESRRATGPFAGKLRALWISAWNLGVVRDRDDVAMMHFVERQTGVPHTRFLQNPADASKAIEAVKAMLVRDGGVEWPTRKGPGSIELKRAIVAAQLRRLFRMGDAVQLGTEPADLDDALAWLDSRANDYGVRLRHAPSVKLPL